MVCHWSAKGQKSFEKQTILTFGPGLPGQVWLLAALRSNQSHVQVLGPSLKSESLVPVYMCIVQTRALQTQVQAQTQAKLEAQVQV